MSISDFRAAGDFPLYILPDAVSTACPECGEPMEEDKCACPACGYDGDPVSAFDPWETEYAHSQIRSAMGDLNASLRFFQISLISGYCSGAQLYVEESAPAPATLDNAACRHTWDLCRSVAIRRRESERRKLCRWMERAADAWNMEKPTRAEQDSTSYGQAVGPLTFSGQMLRHSEAHLGSA